jgi:hypothetical protein
MTHPLPHSQRLCVLWVAGLGYVRAPLGAANLYANATQRHKPLRETLAAFAWGHIGLICQQSLSEGANVNSTLKVQNSETTLIQQIKVEIKKRSEAKAKRMMLKRLKRLDKRSG